MSELIRFPAVFPLIEGGAWGSRKGILRRWMITSKKGTGQL